MISSLKRVIDLIITVGRPIRKKENMKKQEVTLRGRLSLTRRI